MHELSLTRQILNTALRYAQKTNSAKVVTIALRLGALRDIQKEWIQRYFNYLSKGTIAQDAEILVMVSPAVISCLKCGRETEIENLTTIESICVCIHCASQNYKLISGMEFQIEGIGVE